MLKLPNPFRETDYQILALPSACAGSRCQKSESKGVVSWRSSVLGKTIYNHTTDPEDIDALENPHGFFLLTRPVED